MRIRVLVGLACLSTGPLPAQADGPTRIVSMNVCTDQLLVELVDPERIASVSYLAADARSSAIADRVHGLHLNHGAAEEIVALRPDLIVTSQFAFLPTAAVLKRLGYVVVELPMAENLGDIRTNLQTLGAAVEEPDRAAEAIRRFDARLEQLTYRGTGSPPLFVNYDANGWATGQESLVADITHRAGFSTAGDRLGFATARRLPLEQLLVLRPALIDLGDAWDDPPSLASNTFRHPALRQLLLQTQVAQVPDHLWLCGTPRTLEALALMRRERDALAISTGIEPR